MSERKRRSDEESGSGPSLTRRNFLRHGAGGIGLGLFGIPLVGRASGSGADDFGPLQAADGNGLKLPLGFTSRIVATSGQAVSGTSFSWHSAPDGGATFATDGGGWIYVSNSERSGSSGGVGALAFDSSGAIVDAYSILTGTTRNCAGGPTPWGTWLSCEEVSDGEVYECDPFTPFSNGVVRPLLGRFNHEAAAVDPIHETVYLTEDRSDGLLYRFTPSSYPALTSGILEAAEILDPLVQGPIAPGEVRPLAWHLVPEPSPSGGGVQSASHLPLEARATRYQVPAATAFNGGEGCWYEGAAVYCTSKGDNRVWKLDTDNDTVEILYDFATSSSPELSNVDNVTVSRLGDVYVAEDPGNLQIVALTPTGGVVPVVEVTGQTGTEITGPAFSPDGTRLFFSSQRNPGTTYEVVGPFAPLPQIPVLGATARAVLAAALGAAAALRLGRPQDLAEDGSDRPEGSDLPV